MKTVSETPFEAFLDSHNQVAWSAAIDTLLPRIHEVDKEATQIWFAFHPLALFRLLEQAPDPERLARELLLQGNFYLRDQIDSSHTFFYGHRFWASVKTAVEEYASTFDAAADPFLTDEILKIAQRLARNLEIEPALVVGITAVAFMTVQQVGVQQFKAAPGLVRLDPRQAKSSPEQHLKRRAKDDSQGLLGFLKTVDKRWTITYDENDATAKYKLKEMQDLAWGAANDRSRDWRSIDPRRVEGPIPVECRSASCGTCWVGILGGADKLSDVAAREAKQIKKFGYIETSKPKPLIRLACQAQARGAVSIVIPPWNGVFGEYLHQHVHETSTPKR